MAIDCACEPEEEYEFCSECRLLECCCDPREEYPPAPSRGLAEELARDQHADMVESEAAGRT